MQSPQNMIEEIQTILDIYQGAGQHIVARFFGLCFIYVTMSSNNHRIDDRYQDATDAKAQITDF